MKRNFVFTSESVTRGHPDKLCDQISDAVVDHYLARDPLARVITECAIAKGVAFVATRFASAIRADIAALGREVIREVGYRDASFGARDYSILTSIVELPATVRVARLEEELDAEDLNRLTAQNQVTVFGFACNQTPVLMPLPIVLAHRLARALSGARDTEACNYLTPDGTTQVGIEYRDRRPYRVHGITVVVSQQTHDAPALETLREELIELAIKPVFEKESVRLDDRTGIFVNPGGPRIGGGPAVHSGMTGRKTAMDLYGGYAHQSGSALSGKDPLRVDRIAAYVARFAAKNIVAAGLAQECEVQLSYSIGFAKPVSIQVETFGTGKVEDD
jgi:S-adenosylmethionine synthetase